MSPRSAASLRLCAMLLLSTVARAEEPLEWKWSEGDSVRYLMTQKMNMAMNAGPAGAVASSTRQETLMNWVVEAVDPSGRATLAQNCERITMQTDGPMGQGFAYDSASDEAPAGMAALVAPMFDAMVSAPIVAEMLPTGAYADVRMSEDLADAFEQLPGGAVSADMVTQMTKQGSIAFPAAELAPGDTWEQASEIEAPQVGKMNVTTTYTYNGPKEIDGRTLESFTPRIAMRLPEDDGRSVRIDFTTRESTGEILFDREAGRIVRSRIEQTIDIEIGVRGQKVTNTMQQTIEMREIGPNETPALGAAADAAEPSLSE